MELKDINAIIAPLSEQKAAVASWLKDLPNAVVKDQGDSFDVRAPGKTVKRLFDTEIHLFNHDNGHLIARAMGNVKFNW